MVERSEIKWAKENNSTRVKRSVLEAESGWLGGVEKCDDCCKQLLKTEPSVKAIVDYYTNKIMHWFASKKKKVEFVIKEIKTEDK